MEVQEHTSQATENGEQPQEERGRRRGGGDRSPSALTLGPRDSLVGKLTIDGEIRILGSVEGELAATGDVNVEERATVRATIDGRNISVRGDVSGDVTARERLVLTGSGSLNGNVKVARLAIEDGATLNGNVTMQKES
jgi:cytoskeletal protein CcmA (bactofilin family)